MTIRVCTASRLHFGLLALPQEESISPTPALKRRVWGGVGLMVQEPGTELVAKPATEWGADGPLAHRVLQFVERFQSHLQTSERLKPLKFTISRCAPEHHGFGTGTQLGLAVARILAEQLGWADTSAQHLAERVGRGGRSAIGSHGFDVGGFLVEGGKTSEHHISPLIVRQSFPEQWRVLLIIPGNTAQVHGSQEVQAFQHLQASSQQLATEELARLVLLGLLPSLVEQNCSEFGEVLHEFNRKVGEAFVPVQGGVYSHPRSPEIVAYLRSEGVKGVGQSSWGPTLFAVVESESEGVFWKEKLHNRFGFEMQEVLITRADERGARLFS